MVNMLYSFKLETEPLHATYPVVVSDGAHCYRFQARKGDTEHHYANIPVSQMPTVKAEFANRLTTMSFGGKVFMSPLQRKLNEGLARDRNVI